MRGANAMATTKIWKVVKRLDHVMDYATDETKTKNGKRRSGDFIK